MEFPFHFGQKEPKLPEILAPLDSTKYPAEGVTFKGVERAVELPVAPLAELPVAPTAELPAPEASAVETPQEPVDTDHQIPAQTE